MEDDIVPPLPNNIGNNSSDSSWFPALRSKFASFSMSDWLVSLGLSKRKSSNGSTTEDNRKTSSAPTTREHSVEPQSLDAPWEIPNFWLNLEPGRSYNMDTLELQHFGPLEGLVPTGKKQLGAGHEFHVIQLVNPTWCDKCGDFIWGFYKQAVRCKNCNYTCHYKCRLLVTLDCRNLHDSVKSQSTDSTFLTAKSVSLPLFEPDTELSSDQGKENENLFVVDPSPLDWPNDNMPHGRALVETIELYNQDTDDGLGMTLDDNGESFSGYIQIHMNFTRPINIVAGQRPPSMYDVIKEDTFVSDTQRRTITSFFLPRNTVKTVHITSDTTTRELIVSLLRKFKVADNPLKFCLYTVDTAYPAQASRLQRLSDDVCPLRIQLVWGCDSGKQLVLQENETGDILWDAFEIPELNNFLKILELEEQQYIWQIRQRYNLYKHYLEMEIRNQRRDGSASSTAETGEFIIRDEKSAELGETASGSDTSKTIVWEQRGDSTVKINDDCLQQQHSCACENGTVKEQKNGNNEVHNIEWEDFEDV